MHFLKNQGSQLPIIPETSHVLVAGEFQPISQPATDQTIANNNPAQYQVMAALMFMVQEDR